MKAVKNAQTDLLSQAYEGMPATRYQGSKRKFLQFIYESIKSLKFQTCLDAFGGTGSVSHLLRFMGKQVTYNDILPFNAVIARALFSNKQVTLTDEMIDELFNRQSKIIYHNYIADNYEDIYYTKTENEQLDVLCQNIPLLDSRDASDEAYYCLFQTAISKRPYNLFHRANLDIRTRDVVRSFGNKTTWDKSFSDHMKKFRNELCEYKCRQSKFKPVVTDGDAFLLENKFDLVYIDTPYSKTSRVSESNYFTFYHFLDAMLAYDSIPSCLNIVYKHKPFYEPNKLWYPTTSILDGFTQLFQHFSNSIIVLSYRSDGHPTVEELVNKLELLGKRVRVELSSGHNYALASKADSTKEVIMVAE